jgi:DNA-binding GntR family transcriptional regulator
MPTNPHSADALPNNRHSATTETYATLKAAIEAGELKPGDRLYGTVLARRFQVSRTPVREALQRLTNEGLAEERADGVYVASLSVKHVRELEQANRALQSLAAQLAATESTTEEMAALEETMVRMENCAARSDLGGWIAADQEIHRRVCQMSGNRFLSKLFLQMESLISRVRYVALRRPGRIEESTRDHRTVVDAIKTRDPEVAQRVMCAHLIRVEQLTIEILETYIVPMRGDRL